MPFPDSQRVIYTQNPLHEVICQLRFPPILRIDAEPPAAFQERLRAMYPLFREIEQDLPFDNAPAEFAKILKGALLNRTRAMGYEFVSEDGAWLVTLCRDAL